MADAIPSDPTNPPPNPPERRKALLWLAGSTGVVAASALTVPLAAYVFGVFGRKSPPWVRIGPLAHFPKGETRLVKFVDPYRLPWDGLSGTAGAYVRYKGTDREGRHDFMVLAMNCAHLGCPVTWFPQSGLFMCPCHGGVYYADGELASGPPPRGMFRMPWRVADGMLEVAAPHLPTLQDTLKHPSELTQLGVIKRDCGKKA